jgi:hypothetical protein
VTATTVERLTALRRADSQAKAAAVRASLEALATAGTPLTIAAVARHAGVSRRFIYDHPELRATIDLKVTEAIARFSGQLTSTAQVTAASLRADVENTKAENQRLRERIRLLEVRLSEALGHEVAAELAAQGIPINAGLRREEMATLHAKMDELTDELRRRDDDLEGARQANRDLMAELNRRARP